MRFLTIVILATLLFRCGGGDASMHAPSLTVTTNDEAQSGDTVCVDLVVTDFSNITALQYSLEWDDRILTFVRTDDYELPGLSAQDFSPADSVVTDQLAMSWSAAEPATLSDSSAVHSVCFLAEGRTNARSTLVLTNDPKKVMAISNEDTLEVSTRPGRVMIAQGEEE